MPRPDPRFAWLTSARLFAALVVLSVALAWWLNAASLGSGLYTDDHLQAAMLRGDYPAERSALDLYSFSRTDEERAALITQGVLPWWSHPELELSALRPLASASIALDHALRLSPLARHWVSFLWLAALIWAASAWYRRLLPLPAAALATLLFAVDPAHVSPAGWLAHRTALMCGVFGALALARTSDYLKAPSRLGAARVLGLVSLALASGEYALGAVALALPVIGLSAGARSVRLQVLGLWGAPTLLYLGVHGLAGYGAVGSSAYVNLASSPLLFGVALIARWPALFMTELLLVPSELVHGALVLRFWPSLLTVLALGAAVVLAGATMLRFGQTRRLALSLALGLGLSLVPLVATLPATRLLGVASLAGAALIGLAGFEAARAFRAGGVLRRALLAPLIGLTALLHLGLAPFATWQISRGVASSRAHLEQAMQGASIPSGADTLLVMNAYDLSLSSLGYARAAKGHALPRSVWLLTSSPEAVVVERVDARTLRLSTPRGTMLSDPAPFLFRSIDAPLRKGDQVTLPDFEVTVEEHAEHGYRRLLFRFREDLSGARFAPLYVDGSGALRALTLPPEGERLTLPRPPLY
ncbi:MAG: hypothetical protein KIT72_14705 [Polyangiaceae bacterium]|nr:hypothetical protein [Polyangiaceae bacterium]MCW5791665.1 hypothetical protein [Polyangiaceae bacterium]